MANSKRINFQWHRLIEWAMWTPTKKQRWLFAIAGAIWLAIILASGLGVSLFGLKWNFTNTGNFGDSFGPLSAVMASVAALSAIGAYKSQQAELSRQQERDREADLRIQRNEFEGTFFRLLDAFRSIVADTDIHRGGVALKEGRDAFKSMIVKYQNEVARTSNPERSWKATSDYYRNDLNHYFRFLYHIVRYVDNAQGVDAYFYIQLLRALLSESELVLIGLNCAHGEGIQKFKPLVEKYALLHNLSEDAKKRWHLDSLFDATAFGRKPREEALTAPS